MCISASFGKMILYIYVGVLEGTLVVESIPCQVIMRLVCVCAPVH